MALKHVVVDGSNIATEGRTLPSLQQLDDAVQAFLADRPVTKLTVVVDATFGHRIPEKERAEYEEAIVNGEIVCPPAGAIGRGDAFVLQIADKAGATVLSNDSFQEFHAEYPWLFDEGRLIGGKPVPEVGWVFVARAPVRGPVSRQATKNARGPRRPRRSSTKAALEATAPDNPPVPTGKAPKVGDVGVPAKAVDEAVNENGSKARAAKPRASKNEAPANGPAVDADGADGGDGGPQRGSGRRGRGRRGAANLEPTNELLPFLDFIGSHPVGSEVEAEVERFSSHGAYLRVGDILGYAPLRLMGDPPPRSPRDLFDMGRTYTVTVVALDAPRRGVDLTLPQFASDAISAAAESSADVPDDLSGPVAGDGPAATAASPDDTPAASDKAEETPNMATPRKTSTKKSATKRKSPAKKASAAGKTTAKKATPRKTSTAKKSTAKKATPRKTSTAGKSTAKKSTAGKSTAKKSTAKKSTAGKSTAKKSTAKKATPRKTSTAGKSTAKKSPARKTSTAKKSAARKSAGRKSSS